MLNTSDYKIVLKNIYYDLIQMMEEDGEFSLLRVEDMLPIMAADMTRTNWEENAKHNRLAVAIKSYLWKNPRLGLYTKRALVKHFQNEWLPTLSDEEKSAYILDFSLFTEFDEAGFACINKDMYENLKISFQSMTSVMKFLVIHIPTLGKGVKLRMIDDDDFTVYVSENIDGYWTVPTFITADQWYEILQSASEGMLLMLSCFLQMPGHRASVLDIERIFGIDWHSVNANNSALGRKAQTFLGNFEVHSPDGKNRVWSIAMNRAKNQPTGFEWELRPELAEAATKYLNEIGFVYKSKISE